jgi:iron complex outermembrane recepter protein
MNIPHVLRHPRSTRLLAAAMCCLATSAHLPAQPSTPPAEPVVKLEDLETDAGEDINMVLPTEPTRSVFGFARKLEETPRSATIINQVLIDSIGIRNSEDLIKIAPNTFSNFRFGLQGNVSIRNQTSDFYFRGMRRIDPQGNFRTLWTANDSLEIVAGPASPIYGLGRIGGYVNFNPKTARLAKTGKYLDKSSGKLRVTYGSYNKLIATAETGGPADIPFTDKTGGYHVYGYFEDSKSYKVNNFDQQKLVQSTLSFDLSQDFRVETGFVFHNSRGGLPGGINRTTRDTIARGTYWDGGFSYQMDQNRDGAISDRETFNSYFGGTPQLRAALNDPARVTSGTGPSLYYNGQNNDPFFRNVPWQGNLGRGIARSLNPETISLSQFTTGYTQTYNAATTAYLASQGAPTSVQRQGYQLLVYPVVNGVPNTSAAPQTFFLPFAFDLDAASFVEKPLNKRQSFGEDYYKANIGTVFLDFINDVQEDRSLKNQSLLDWHRQIKDGRNPFSQIQEVTTLENKTTLQRKFTPASWYTVDTLASANIYYLDTYRVATSPTDIDFRRSLVHNDAQRVEDTFTPNDTFYSMIHRRGLDGNAPRTTSKSNYTNSGLGVLLDNTFFNRIGLIVGGRWDYVDAHAVMPAGQLESGGNYNPGTRLGAATTDPTRFDYPFSPTAGTGLFSPVDYKASATDQDVSTSVSLSYKPFTGVTLYGTSAKQALIVNNASAQEFAIRPLLIDQLMGKSKLTEGGLKLNLLKETLKVNVAFYEQTRISFDTSITVGGAASSTLSRGWESDIRWVINPKWTVIGGISLSQAKYLQGGNVSVDARTLGYPDVVDASGKVVIPAEAFGWGGRLQTTIPDSEPDYREVERIPNHVANLTLIYNPTRRWTLQTTVYSQGSFATDRLHTINVPSAVTVDGSIGYRADKWEVDLNIRNIADTEIWNGGSFYWLDPKFQRTLELSYTYKF